VIPNGGPSDTVEPTLQNKAWAKEKLGMAGKRVVITTGLLGPDKGVQFVIPALFYKLPTALKENLIYIVAGQPGDCGADCIEYYSFLESQLNEFGGDLVERVAFMPERLTLEGWKDLWAAADVAIMLYPEDIIPHPGTFSQALTAGVVPVVTPFAAAISLASESSAVLVWERDPVHVGAGLESVLKLSDEDLLKMQRNAWNVGRKIGWEKIGADFVSKVVIPTLNIGRAGGVLQNVN
jgi:glycosyltransferase involved in cell wall biosynthesis